MNTESVVEIASAVAPKTCPSMRVERTWRISASAPERKKQIATSTRRDENTERAESTDRGKSQKESFTTEARRHGGTEARRHGGTEARRHGGTEAQRIYLGELLRACPKNDLRCGSVLSVPPW